MEEMSRQLGENMPIAMEAGAKSMGLSIGDFIKQVETGSVLAKDFMLPFARELRRQVRENGALEAAQKKLTAQQQRMNTEFKVLIDDIFQDGLSQRIGSVFGMIANALRSAAPHLRALGKALGDTLGVTTRLVEVVFDLTDAADKQANSMKPLTRAWYGLVGLWYSALVVLEAIVIAYDKLRWLDRTVGRFVGVYSTPEETTQNATRMGNGQGRTNNVSIGQVNLTSTTSDPERHAMELLNQFTHQLGQ